MDDLQLRHVETVSLRLLSQRDRPASVQPTTVTIVRAPARRTEPGIALKSYPSPGCDEPRRGEWGSGQDLFLPGGTGVGI
jgi:hypothetical protein